MHELKGTALGIVWATATDIGWQGTGSIPKRNNHF